MLQTLKIKNIALIDNAEINFDSNLNVITGETGAGKTIILDSLNFILGSRADKSLIRNGENYAKVDGLFNIDINNENIKNFFDKINLPVEEQILISRIMSHDGKNEIKINGEIITLSMLKELTINLVDIYGQNEQICLLKPNYQLSLIDNTSNEIKSLINEYKTKKNQLSLINKQLNELGGNKEEREREIDLLDYQINEIEQANLNENEEKELLEKKNILINIEKITSLMTTVSNQLNIAANNANLAKNNLLNAVKYDNNLNELLSRLESSIIEFSDIENEVNDYNSYLNFNELDLAVIYERLEVYKNLQRKYGKTVEEVFIFYSDIKERYNILINSDFEINKLNKEKQLILKELFITANQLTIKRKDIARSLSIKIKQNLANLGMQNADIIFNFNEYENIESSLSETGCDSVDILFSANKGEVALPLKEVASGGEMSRIMLAFKSIIAESDNIPTMIFDEIDTGISGLMAQAVAIELYKISKNHQIILITHTAQIASIADSNYYVEKIERENRTFSKVSKLNYDMKVKEIARFLSNTQKSIFALENAKHLIEEQNKIKVSI